METMKRLKKRLRDTPAALVAAAAVLADGGAAHAQFGGNEAQIGSFFTQAGSWIVTVLGPGMLLIGLGLVGLNLAVGNRDGMQKGAYVLGGGALVFLAPAVVALMRRLATGF